ncbi:trans-aconitate 3-methyltransferase-like isoform X3 [Tachyglossus aculeatus]|uniref:trans-aconitate 3-methyltransferase-like isoform X3 n=1 Tax=Tachyglossus aculeatus TaxID=9261 RepID=UPI0018F34274|nr:trans-aconitate 3-methyltransferase-like isoform X3 [Tachyglossus aculeatus]
MSVQLFEGEDHAALYQKYRFPPSAEVLDLIFSFLGEKKQKPYKLAVDVGCGSGQSTRVLAPHFERVLGTDISEAQIQQAGKAPSPHNVSYRVCPAEELPLEDASVDLVTAFTAAHWFDTERFLQEVTRVLKPQGCVALSTYLPRMSLQFGDRSDQLTQIFREDSHNIQSSFLFRGSPDGVHPVLFHVPDLPRGGSRGSRRVSEGDSREVLTDHGGVVSGNPTTDHMQSRLCLGLQNSGRGGSLPSLTQISSFCGLK